MIVLLLIMGGAAADIAIQGISPYNFQYNISNAWMYPDYQFLTSSAIWGWQVPGLIENGSFGGGYKLDSISIYAIRKDELNQTILDELNRSNTMTLAGERGGKVNLSGFLVQSSAIRANSSFPVAAFYEDDKDIQNVTVNLVITNLSPSGFNIIRDTAVFRYNSGKKSEVKINGSEDGILPPSS